MMLGAKQIRLLAVLLFLVLLPLGSPALSLRLLPGPVHQGPYLRDHAPGLRHPGRLTPAWSAWATALFFGLGGYAAAFTINNLSTNLAPVLLVALVAAIIVGLFVGFSLHPDQGQSFSSSSPWPLPSSSIWPPLT